MHRFLTTALPFDHGDQVPTAEGAGLCSLLLLDMAIDALDRAKEATGIIPAKTAFTSAGALLIMIRVLFLPVRVDGLLANVYRTQ